MSGLFFCHGCKRDLPEASKHPKSKINGNFCCNNCSNKKNSFNRLSDAETIIAKLKLEAERAESNAISKKAKDARLEKLRITKVRLNKLIAKKEEELINKECFELDYDMNS